jgi:hypothetical protein
MPSPAVSLAAEVQELENVVVAAQLLVDLLRYQQWGEEGDVERIPRATSALLALLACRMRQTARVLRREASPETITAPFNQALGDEEEEMVLPIEVPKQHSRRRR